MQPGELPTASAPQVKRFTTRRKPVEFYVDDDLFRGVPALPAMHALELTRMHSELQAAEGKGKLDILMGVFSSFLEDASYERFAQRLQDKSNPIDLGTLMDVIQWILGEGYGLRPTQKPSPSEPGSAASTGHTSTDGAPPGMSIPELSSGSGSST